MPLQDSISAELEMRRRKREKDSLVAPEDWQTWCKTMFPKYFREDFAPHHEEYWNWLDSIVPDVPPKAFIGIWGRGDAKSTSAETGVVRIGSKGVRKYVLYVSSTQDKADGHVQTIGSMLESKPYSNYYGKMSRRAVNKYGTARGWKHNRLITSTGFAVDAFGLDSGLRGAKIEEARPDFIIVDDVDERFDTPATTMKKIGVITENVLPTGSDDCAVVFIQNLITADSIASRLADGRADFLKNRILSGPHPATRDLEYHYDEHQGIYIVDAGQPTWSSRTLADVEAKINLWGLSAYLREAQHEVDRRDGPWANIPFLHISYEELPVFEDVQFWVDPAVTDTDNSNCQGISGGGYTGNRLYGLYFWEGVQSPLKTLEQAIEKAYEWGASCVGVETDQGGDTWKSVYKEAADNVLKKMEKARMREWEEENPGVEPPPMPEIVLPKFTSDKVSSVKGARSGMSTGSKMERNSRMMTDYEKSKVIHMFGTHTVIEKALWRVPTAPWDLADSWWWTWFSLMGSKKERFGAR